MLHYLLTTIYRSLFTKKRGTLTNVSALAIGIASVLFVSNLLHDETNYDRNLKNLYRVEVKHELRAGSFDALVPVNIGPKLVKQSDQLTEFVRLIPFSAYKSANLRMATDSSEVAAYFKNTYIADATVINLFRLELLLGDANNFGTAGTMIISEQMAIEKFGKDWQSEALGTKFKNGRGSIQQRYELVGVFANRLANSHLQADALISLSPGDVRSEAATSYTYVATQGAVASSPMAGYHLRPAMEIHTSEGVSNEVAPVANRSLLLLLSGVAILILLITVTNYVNNTIIHFMDRCKQVGIRKLHGATVGQLFGRLLLELLSVNFLAALLGTLLFVVCVLTVHRYALMSYPPVEMIKWPVMTLVVIVTILVNTCLSMIYPLIILNKLEIVQALKGPGSFLKSKAFGNAGMVVRSLLVFQILMSVVFMSASLIIYRQLQLLNLQPASQEVRIKGVFPGISGANGRFPQEVASAFKDIALDGSLINYSFSNMQAGRVKTEQQVMLNDNTPAYLTVVDPNYFHGIGSQENKLLWGEWFDPGFGNNAGKVLLDSAIARPERGYVDSTQTWHVGKEQYHALGAVKTPPDQISRAYVSGFRYLTYVDLVLNFQGNRGDRLDQFLEKKEYIISTKMPYFFLLSDDQEASGKAAEEVLVLFVFFGGVSLLVTIMGLLGLSHFVTQKKSKEVGIRKVHGASVWQILANLLSDFAQLVLIGSLLALPFIYFGGQYWLEYYANRIALDLSIFLPPIALITFITLLTVLDKSWNAATLNPITILEER